MSEAKEFTKNPIEVARGEERIFFVPEGDLPAIRSSKDPFSMLSEKELFKLKKKYRVPNAVFRKIRKCYEEKDENIALAEYDSLECRLLLKEIEDSILDKLKREYVRKDGDFLPAYDPSITARTALHTAVVGSSGTGKSTIVSEIIANFFPDQKCFVFSPTASTDPAYQKLQAALGKGRVKLINSNSVDIPLDIKMLSPYGCVCVFDDIESTTEPARNFISKLQNSLLYEGRHRVNKKTGYAITVFSIFHDAFNKSVTKSSSIEASRVILFPNTNRSNATKYLKNRLHFSMKDVKSLYKFVGRSRWVSISLTHPSVAVTSTSVQIR